jgi:hypothetical protein
MQNLSEFTITELQDLIQNAKNEIALREAAGNGFDAEFCRVSKAYYPCTRRQIDYAESLAKKTGSVIEPSISQLMKYFEGEEMSEAIELMKAGKRIKIS